MAPRIPKQNTRFINPQAESSRGRSALEALRGYAGAPSQASVMHPGSRQGYEAGELAGMAEALIPGASLAKGALGAALAGVIKPRGGNWIPGDVESSISNLLLKEYTPASVDLQRTALEMARQRGYDDNMIAELARGLQQRETPIALNRWIEGPLTKYIKRDMATPEDPIRRLADEGILHMGIPQTIGVPSTHIRNLRVDAGFPQEGLSETPGGSLWENLSDRVISSGQAKYLQEEPKMMAENPWMQKLDPESTVYGFQSSIERGLGFDHLIDELKNAMNPESGLPRNLLLRPEQMQQMGVEKAVRHVDAINKWREAQRAAANAELANKAMVVREYAENNPKGLRWMELGPEKEVDEALIQVGRDGGAKVELPGEEVRYFNSPEEAKKHIIERRLEKQLRYEGDTMGHCVGGYCPDVLEGNSRIFSLRDAKGEPHVTVEVGPGLKPNIEKLVDDAYRSGDYSRFEKEFDQINGPGAYQRLDREMLESGMGEDLWDFTHYALQRHPETMSQWAQPSIKQVKGKQNLAPKDEYLPFVQDFVRNSPIGVSWGRVDDLKNTGLRKVGDRYVTLDEMKDVPRTPDGLPIGYEPLDDLPGWKDGGRVQERLLTPPQERKGGEFAEGGSVKTPRIPKRNARFVSPGEEDRGRAAFEALRGYAGAPSQASVMHPGALGSYEAGELAGMAEMLVPGAAMAKGALGAALAGVIKPRGGNWLSGSVEKTLQGMKKPGSEVLLQVNGPNSPNYIIHGPIQDALNRWIEGPLTKYIKRDMATEQDPVRALAEQGILHFEPDMRYVDSVKSMRKYPFNEDYQVIGKRPLAKEWERTADQFVNVVSPEEVKRYPELGIENSPWVENLPEDSRLYAVSSGIRYHPDTGRQIVPTPNPGFGHLIDELNNALNPESGLPRNLLLRPEQMQQMGMEKAVRHVDAINKWRAAQKAAADAEIANKAMTLREYPDSPELPNPQGLRWVELSKDSPDLEKQLKYEGRTMRHCVGGQCEDVLEGRSRIFSLRDSKGEPHVTIEVAPPGRGSSSGVPEDGEHQVMWPDILQIKGKQNKAPREEYLPFVRDFVRNSPLGGSWGDVGDLGNARLHRFQDESGVRYLTPEEYNLPPKREGGLVTQPDYFDDLDAFLGR